MLSNSSKVWVKSSFQLASLQFDWGVHHFEIKWMWSWFFCYEAVALTAHMQENIMSYLGKTRLMPFTGQDAKEMLGRAEITITRTGQQTWVVLLSFHSLLPMFLLLGYRFNWKSAVLKCCFVFWRLYCPRLFFTIGGFHQLVACWVQDPQISEEVDRSTSWNRIGYMYLEERRPHCRRAFGLANTQERHKVLRPKFQVLSACIIYDVYIYIYTYIYYVYIISKQLEYVEVIFIYIYYIFWG